MPTVAEAVSALVESVRNVVGRVSNLEARSAAAQSYSNQLVNGGFEGWRRGDGPFTSGLCADGWEVMAGVGSVLSCAKSNDVFGASEQSLAVTYTHAVVSSVQQTLQSDLSFVGVPLALSVRIKTDVPGAVRLFIGNIHGTGCIGSGDWEPITVIATPTVGPVVVGIEFDKSGTIVIDDAMLVQGSSPVPYIFDVAQESIRITVGNTMLNVEQYRKAGDTDTTTINKTFRAADGFGGEIHFGARPYNLVDRLILPKTKWKLVGHEEEATVLNMPAGIHCPILVDQFSDYLWQGLVPPGGAPYGPGGTVQDILFDAHKSGALVANIPNIWLTGGYSNIYSCIVNNSAWHGVLFGDPSGALPQDVMAQCNVILSKFGNCAGSSIYNHTQSTAAQFRFNTIGASGLRHIHIKGGANWVTDNILFESGLQGILCDLSGGQMDISRNDIRDGRQTMIEISIADGFAYQASGIRCDDNDLGVDLLDADNNWNGIYIHQSGAANNQLDAVSCQKNNIYRVHFASDPHPTWKLANGIVVLGSGGGVPGNAYVLNNMVDQNAAVNRLNLYAGATVIDPWPSGGVGFGQDISDPGANSVGFRNWQAALGQDIVATGRAGKNISLNADHINLGVASSQGIGHYGHATATQLTVGGSRGGNAALASLLTQLAANGIIIDTSTP